MKRRHSWQAVPEPPDSYWAPDGGARERKRTGKGGFAFALCCILGAEKRRATVLILRAAFGGALRLAWVELFFDFFSPKKS